VAFEREEGVVKTQNSRAVFLGPRGGQWGTKTPEMPW